mgnify:CR=1 FL=1
MFHDSTRVWIATLTVAVTLLAAVPGGARTTTGTVTGTVTVGYDF